MVGALIEGRAHQHLVDFDCHLDDIREDWTNQQLNAQITPVGWSHNGKWFLEPGPEGRLRIQ